MASGNGLCLNWLTGSPIHFYFSAQALSRNLHKRFCESHFAGRTKHGATEFWLTLGLILLVYQVELNVLVPGVLGKEMRLHPVNILFLHAGDRRIVRTGRSFSRCPRRGADSNCDRRVLVVQL